MKFGKSELLNLAVLAVTVLGMVLSSKAQEQDMLDVKSEILAELRNEKENK